MEFLVRKGQRYLVRCSNEETEAVKIAVSNLTGDMEKVLGAAGTVVMTAGTEPEETGAEGMEAGTEPEEAGAEGMIAGTTPEETGAEGMAAGTEPEETGTGGMRDEENDGECAQIVVGTVGVSQEIDRWLAAQEDKGALWQGGVLRKEAYLMRVQEGKLYIAGSDRRGTVYGIYEFCSMIGVSPWYFWADVPVKEKEEICFSQGFERTDYPSVEYRGIFINDEEELEAWVKGHMGEDTIGVKTYEKVFELLLRLKANYIWPAMHVNSFNMKRENGALADRMGIVVGTSHCDMLMRSNNREWRPWIEKKGYEDARYDYSIPGRNREILQEYWRESVEQNGDFEVCYTLGMRGIHDSGFETEALAGKSEEEKRKAKVELLETVIRDQRKILKDTLGRDTMMTFIPYKEVLELYDNGLEIPEDMTLVWANDNYGYIRRYPSEREKYRSGGNGIYYHNSYWAPPSMSYVFLCSIPLAHTKNELEKAYAEGIRKLWVLNVGAIKPLEQEIEFFLRLAWEIGKEKTLTQDVDAYVADWIDRNFSGGIGTRTARLLNDFSQLTNVRKLENMDQDAFSQTAYGDEAVVRIHRYEEMFREGNEIYSKLPDTEKPAFFQMVLMRIHAAYFTNLQFYYGDRSTLACEQGKMQAAALYTIKAQEADDARRRMLVFYNDRMLSGKWSGILNPESFPPPRASMMPVCTPPLFIGERKLMVNIWNDKKEITFVKPGVKWLEVANGGEGEIGFEIKAPEWITLSEYEGTVRTEKRILVTAEDISQDRCGEILVKDGTDGSLCVIPVRIVCVDVCSRREAASDVPDEEAGLAVSDVSGEKAGLAASDVQVEYVRSAALEEDGMVAVEASASSCGQFKIIKRLGRCCGSLAEARKEPVRGQEKEPLNYWLYFTSKGEFLMEIHRFPSLNSTGRIRVGVSVDGGEIMTVESFSTDEWRGTWKKNVLNNVDRLYLKLPRLSQGLHRISFHAVDPYFAFSRFVIYTEERKENNLAGVFGPQALPTEWDMEGFAREFYGEIQLKPRPVEYAPLNPPQDNLMASDIILYPEQYAEKVSPNWYLQEGAAGFREQKGEVRIDAAAALAESEYAFTSNGKWSYLSSESYGRSGLAMYIRGEDLSWEDPAAAPSLHYKVMCEGGEYILWILTKFNHREESFVSAGVDGRILSQEELYCKGMLWRYESEQIYRWAPLARLKLEKGEHEIRMIALSAGIRIDRICLIKGEELPPLDEDWKRA